MKKILGLSFATALAAGAATLGVAHADGTEGAATAVESGMPSAVERFAYPNASQIEEETGAILKSGDGHLLFMECDDTQDIRIEGSDGGDVHSYCFRVTTKPAFISLEIPQAYGIWTTDDPVKTTVRKEDGATTVINAPAAGFTGYGEAGADRERTTLIELRVSG
ncbi:hypothetical protein ABZ707_33030 [Streptomyces sp. NPDC006923]|uniref:hypothetical protein n=1 Tax=Streptomyces sp. NPDC006923 TaxID=3155355 RepID=UPI0034079F31